MFDDKEYLTIQEAQIYSNKSEKTLRNLTKTLLIKNKTNASKVASKNTSKLLVKEKGKRQFYLFSKVFLDENFTSKQQHFTSKVEEGVYQSNKVSHDSSINQIILDNLDFLKTRIEKLEESNKNLQVLLKNQQDLTLESQHRVSQLEEERRFVLMNTSVEQPKRKKFLGIF
jgi:hypothetical protein